MLFYLLVRMSIALWGLDWPVDRDLAEIFCGVSLIETVAEIALAVAGIACLLGRRGRG